MLITSFKSHRLLAKGESLPYLFRGNFFDRVCFDLPVERISASVSGGEWEEKAAFFGNDLFF